ncbi:MAG: hypothetical protein GY696_15650 [Gammaproteobacteria bacterium]|nr:hypothetical protein [Gammaproteobacteria bacterium]
MVNFINLPDAVPQVHSFIQFYVGPSASDCMLITVVLTAFLLPLIHTGPAERKSGLSLGFVGKNRMQEASRWFHSAINDPLVGLVGLGDPLEILTEDDRMAN